MVHGGAYFGRQSGQKPSGGARDGVLPRLGFELGTEDGFSRARGVDVVRHPVFLGAPGVDVAQWPRAPYERATCADVVM